MSDTTKINKARVNGVLYDLGGSGGTGGVSGAWLAPGELIESGYIDAGSGSSWTNMTIDPEALITQLEKAGIDVDEAPFMDSNEQYINIGIGHYYQLGYNSHYTPIDIELYPDGMEMAIVGGEYLNTSANPQLYSLRQLIYGFFNNVTDLYCSVPQYSGNFSTLANYIQIYYETANTTLRYYIPDMSEFCDEVFVEYNPSSESSS